MKIQLRTFGVVSDHLKDTTIEIAPNATIRDLRHVVLQRYPELSQQYFRMAIGTRMAEDDSELMDGDEVSLMPPFAGG
jgi:molybdopterin converting factor small subunit